MGIRSCCFVWYQFVKYEILEYLSIKNEIRIEDEEIFNKLKPFESKSKQEIDEMCLICFEDRKGYELETCSISADCGHKFCRYCLQDHCESRIKDGQMTNVSCPDPDCRAKIDGHVVQKLVSPEHFNRYDQTLLNFAIRSMSGTVWCPRLSCQHPAQILSEESMLAQCPACAFVFCTKCERTNHGKTECEQVEKSDPNEEQETSKSKDFIEFERLAVKYGHKKAREHAAKIVENMFFTLAKRPKVRIGPEIPFRNRRRTGRM